MQVTNKATMYEMLHAGKFGNTVPMWFNVGKWRRETSCPPFHNIAYWGVRTLTPGGPCELNCPDYAVRATALDFIRRGFEINISPMIDRIVTVTMWANICRSVDGLIVECIEYPNKESNWRAEMPTKAETYIGVLAALKLYQHLNANSHDDLNILLDTYPDAVVELSATQSEWGTVPGRNAIIWEVRNY